MRYIYLFACVVLISCSTKHYGTPYYSNDGSMAIDVDLIDSNSTSALDELLFGKLDGTVKSNSTIVEASTPNAISDVKKTRQKVDSNARVVIDININDSRTITSNVQGSDSSQIKARQINDVQRIDSTSKSRNVVPVSTEDSKKDRTPVVIARDTVYTSVFVTDTVKNQIIQTEIVSDNRRENQENFTPDQNVQAVKTDSMSNSIPDSLSIEPVNFILKKDTTLFDTVDSIQVELPEVDSNEPDQSMNDLNSKQDSIMLIELTSLRSQLIAEKAKTAKQALQLKEMKGTTTTVVEKVIETDTLIRIIKESNEIKKFIFYFDLGTSTARNEQAILDSIASFEKDQGNIAILLAGYTDASGRADLNMKLSKTRTDTVKKQLVQKGVNPQSVFVQYFGEEFATAEKNEKDRRVECTVYKKE